MRFCNFSFGSFRPNGRPFEHDVVIDRREIRDQRQIAGDERSRVRGKASQGQIADSAHNQSHRGIANRPRRHQRDHPCDMLSA